MFVSFRIRYNQRPPSLLAPGVLHFRTEQSHKYYFHPKVSIPSIYAPSIRKIFFTTSCPINPYFFQNNFRGHASQNRLIL